MNNEERKKIYLFLEKLKTTKENSTEKIEEAKNCGTAPYTTLSLPPKEEKKAAPEQSKNLNQWSYRKRRKRQRRGRNRL